jgi:hypothetical protein
MKRTASCSCGQLEVTCADEPVRISVCHCYACQKRTGSTFGAQARFPKDKVTIRGSATSYVRMGDSGMKIDFRFCPTCGSTVYYTIDAQPDLVAVAVGNFADREFPEPGFAVYEARRHPWVKIEPKGEIEVWD